MKQKAQKAFSCFGFGFGAEIGVGTGTGFCGLTTLLLFAELVLLPSVVDGVVTSGEGCPAWL